MEITKNNYFKVIEEIGQENLSESLKKGYDLVSRISDGGKDWSNYHKYQNPIELHFKVVGFLYDKFKKTGGSTEKDKKINQRSEKPKIEPIPYKTHSKNDRRSQHVPSDRKVKPAHKTERFEKPKVKGKGVELMNPEVGFIKRFVSLNNKTKSREQVVAFIRALQKAIIEKRIRKTSKYAKTMVEIQKQLVTAYRKMKAEITFQFSEKDLLRYYKMAGSEIVLPSVRFIKAYYGIQGKVVKKDKVKNLLDRIQKAIENEVLLRSDKYYKHIRIIIGSLQDHLKNETPTPKISEAELNGLEGVLQDCGCNIYNNETIESEELNGIELEDDGVMTVDEARKSQFRAVELTGDWLRLIGKMCLPTHFLVYGLGGSGKTSFVLLFTQYLAKMGYKILYIAREQYNTPTFTELLNRLNIEVGDNFKIVKDFGVLNPKDFDFVVLDSKDDMDIELKSFVKLKEQYPNQSFLMISQGTKDGNFTGTGRWRNVVDVMIYAENGVIKTGLDKNRWGGSGEMKLT